MKKKPVYRTLSQSDSTPQEKLALQIFSEYEDRGSSDILIINKTKNLIFLDDYNYTLDKLKANNSLFSRVRAVFEEDFMNSL